VAYRQPVTRQEIEYLRGVDSGAVLKTLLEKRLVKILGKKISLAGRLFTAPPGNFWKCSI